MSEFEYKEIDRDMGSGPQEQEALRKEAALLELLGGQPAIAVAFSGGVDSVYLAWAAARSMNLRAPAVDLGVPAVDLGAPAVDLGAPVMGPRALAVTACAHSFPERELEDARACAEQIGIAHETFLFDEFQVPGFAQNPPDRCYHCKSAILTKIKELAAGHGINWVAEGSNADDDKDYRPGARAIREQGVHSPLRDVGLTKAEIRLLSKRAGLPTWEKQSAACLASRFAYGEEITIRGLRMVEQAEDLLRDLGFAGQLRVRIHGGNLARLEVAADQLPKLLDGRLQGQIAGRLKEIGFSYVTLDLQGYRMGSMNEVL